MNHIESLNKLYQGCAALLDPSPNNGKPRYDRIIFIGTHGTGKSTLANLLSKETGMPVVESVAREVKNILGYLEDTGMIKTNNIADYIHKDSYQNVLCSMARWDFMRWVNTNIPCIMTRCPLDTIAYAIADTDVSQHVVHSNLNVLREDKNFIDAIKNSMFVYFPIEFDIEDDGVRPTDKDFQKMVDEAMCKLIYEFGITPLVVHGSVDNRLKTIMQVIERYDTD
jgi:predicted ATPase